MLLRRDILDGIAAGRVSVAFRRWKRPTVKAGGRLRTRIGMLSIDAVDRVEESEIGEEDAKRAGFSSRAALIERLAVRTEGTLYRVEFHLSNVPDPRVVLRERAEIS